MTDSDDDLPAFKFGSGEFEFGEWVTPFTDAEIEILEVLYSPKRERHYRIDSLLPEHDDRDLVARIYIPDTDKIYRVVFPWISAMRLLDEGGLMELWVKTREFGGRPGQTTFRVRNHAWVRESFASFMSTDDGWSFVIASRNECLEVLTMTAPIITEE